MAERIVTREIVYRAISAKHLLSNAADGPHTVLGSLTPTPTNTIQITTGWDITIDPGLRSYAELTHRVPLPSKTGDFLHVTLTQAFNHTNINGLVGSPIFTPHALHV